MVVDAGGCGSGLTSMAAISFAVGRKTIIGETPQL
jgi:hypothetical protein